MDPNLLNNLLFVKSTQEIDLDTIAGDQPLVIITDNNTEKHCLPRLSLPDHYLHLSFDPGENAKSLKTAKKIWLKFIGSDVSRNSVVVNLGGGVITDLGGFAASLYKRGIPFINIPTSLIGMVDAAIGGKVAINFDALKNYIGVFNHPMMVIICPEFLNTLPRKEIRSGYAEMMKHGLIADVSHWRELTKISFDAFEPPSMELIMQSVHIKSAIVEIDPTENSSRKILNFGHTIGHAIESLFARDHKHVSHGEAIAAGMVVEAFLSSVLNEFSRDELEEVTDVITKTFGKIILDPTDFDDIVKFASKDKKSMTGELNFTLLDTIGKATINHKADGSSVIQALRYYDSL